MEQTELYMPRMASSMTQLFLTCLMIFLTRFSLFPIVLGAPQNTKWCLFLEHDVQSIGSGEKNVSSDPPYKGSDIYSY